MGAGIAYSGAITMQPDDLMEMIRRGDAPTIVDVRSRWEYERGHVPGAIHVPFWAACFRASRIQGPVVIYCEHGPRAVLARAALFLRGFRSIEYLAGHMIAWRRSGLPLA